MTWNSGKCDAFQRGDVSAVGDGDAQSGLGDLVAGEDHTGDRGDIDRGRPEALMDDNLRRGQLGGTE
jgi:hypothetical protein